MARYRKKPVEIEASQWFKNGDHPLDYAKDEVGFEGGQPCTYSGEHRKANGWEGGVVRYFRRPDVPGRQECKHCEKQMHAHGWIDTLEGGHIVCPGDYVITGVKGEQYPCKPDIFAATYDEVVTNHPKPTIAELEQLLAQPDTHTTINPDGSVTTEVRQRH
jgi:hypothetical protein